MTLGEGGRIGERTIITNAYTRLLLALPMKKPAVEEALKGRSANFITLDS